MRMLKSPALTPSRELTPLRRLLFLALAAGLALCAPGLALADGVVSLAPCVQTYCAIAPTTTTAVASNQVLKAAPGNGYRYAATTGATAGWLMIIDAITAPGDGAVTPKICRAVAANTSIEIDHSTMPDKFLVGIVEVFSSTGCYTKTASATADLEGQVQ